jgi:hypothetical protein
MAWDNEFALISSPHVVPRSVAVQMPTEIADPLLKVTTLH